MRISLDEFDGLLSASSCTPLPGEQIVAALSGGPDSTALYLLLSEWCGIRNVRLIGMTVDHALRSESSAEAAGVRSLLSSRGDAHATYRLSWRDGLGVRHGGLSEIARERRYASLASFCKALDARRLFVAHTRDDRIETALLRFARGSGLAGLPNMKSSSVLAAGLLVAGGQTDSLREAGGGSEIEPILLCRPFRSIPKERLIQHCLTLGVPFATDRSNFDEKYDRVRVRKAVASWYGNGAGGEGSTKMGDFSSSSSSSSPLAFSSIPPDSIARVLDNLEGSLKDDVWREARNVLQRVAAVHPLWGVGCITVDFISRKVDEVTAARGSKEVGKAGSSNLVEDAVIGRLMKSFGGNTAVAKSALGTAHLRLLKKFLAQGMEPNASQIRSIRNSNLVAQPLHREQHAGAGVLIFPSTTKLASCFGDTQRSKNTRVSQSVLLQRDAAQSFLFAREGLRDADLHPGSLEKRLKPLSLRLNPTVWDGRFQISSHHTPSLVSSASMLLADKCGAITDATSSSPALPLLKTRVFEKSVHLEHLYITRFGRLEWRDLLRAIPELKSSGALAPASSHPAILEGLPVIVCLSDATLRSICGTPIQGEAKQFEDSCWKDGYLTTSWEGTSRLLDTDADRKLPNAELNRLAFAPLPMLEPINRNGQLLGIASTAFGSSRNDWTAALDSGWWLPSVQVKITSKSQQGVSQQKTISAGDVQTEKEVLSEARQRFRAELISRVIAVPSAKMTLVPGLWFAMDPSFLTKSLLYPIPE